MKYTVIKALDNTPSEIILSTKSLDRAISAVTDSVTALVRPLAKKGYRLNVMDSSKRNNYLGDIWIPEETRKGKAFSANFDAQYAEIRFKMVYNMYEGKSSAVFVSTGFNNSTSISYTIVKTGKK